MIRVLTEGVRQAELVQIRLDDLLADLIARPYIRVVPLKGARAADAGRIVPLTLATAKALVAYLRARQSHGRAQASPVKVPIEFPVPAAITKGPQIPHHLVLLRRSGGRAPLPGGRPSRDHRAGAAGLHSLEAVGELVAADSSPTRTPGSAVSSPLAWRPAPFAAARTPLRSARRAACTRRRRHPAVTNDGGRVRPDNHEQPRSLQPSKAIRGLGGLRMG
jgi:hypothetical protein